MSDATDDEKQLFNKFCCALKFIKANNIEHLQSKYGGESQTLSKFGREYWETIRKTTRAVLSHLEEFNASDELHNYNMKIIVSNSESLKFFSATMFSDSNKHELETIAWDSGWNLEPVHVNEGLDSHLIAISTMLNSFAKIIAPIKSKNYTFL